MVNYVVVIIFGLLFFGYNGLAAPTPAATGTKAPASSAPPSEQHKLHHYPCSLNNLHELESVENIIIYSLTHECHLYAWRDGFAPKLKDVGLNGTETLIIRDTQTNADRFGPFVHSNGFKKPCSPENGVIVFMDRQDQRLPQLVIMAKYFDDYYSIIKLNIEELLATKPYISQSLLEQFDESGIPVYINQTNHPKSCIFVRQELHCFSLANDHTIKQIIYKLGKKDGKDVYGEYSSKDHVLSKLRIIEPVMAATWDGNKNDASVYVYDEITDGWLYKFNGNETTASGTRRQTMHKIPTTQKMLKNLWTIDRHLMIVSKCSNIRCQYFWLQIQPTAHSQFTCLFTSPINVITGVVTDVRLQPLIGQQQASQDVPEAQALSAGWLLPDSTNSYWPLIILATICLLVVVIVLICGFIYESVGFKRRYLIEKAADEKYSSIFWNNNYVDPYGMIDEYPGYYEIVPPVEEKPKPPAIEENLSLLAPPAKPELPQQSRRLLFTEEENQTPPSLKKEMKKDVEMGAVRSKTKRSVPKPATPKKKQKEGEFKELKMSTHKPQALRKKGSRRTPKLEGDDDDQNDKTAKTNKEDVHGSIQLSKKAQLEPLESGQYTNDKLPAPKKKQQERKGRKVRKTKSRSTK